MQKKCQYIKLIRLFILLKLLVEECCSVATYFSFEINYTRGVYFCLYFLEKLIEFYNTALFHIKREVCSINAVGLSFWK